MSYEMNYRGNRSRELEADEDGSAGKSVRNKEVLVVNHRTLILLISEESREKEVCKVEACNPLWIEAWLQCLTVQPVEIGDSGRSPDSPHENLTILSPLPAYRPLYAFSLRTDREAAVLWLWFRRRTELECRPDNNLRLRTRTRCFFMRLYVSFCYCRKRCVFFGFVLIEYSYRKFSVFMLPGTWNPGTLFSLFLFWIKEFITQWKTT